MKYQAYESYKDSGVTWESEVPSPWVETRFKWILTEKKKVSNFNLPAGSISFGNVVFKNEDSLAEDTKASYQELLQGEFLINPLNLNYDLKSLRTALSDKNVVVSTGYIILNSKEGFNKNYLRWVLQEFDVAHMKTLGAGVRQTITFADIGNSIFHYPNIDEQTHIAKFLDYETAKIDDLIAKQVRLIELLKEKRQAVISHAVTKGLDPNAPMKDSGVEWLGEIPKHWEFKKLKYVAKLLSDKKSVKNRKVIALENIEGFTGNFIESDSEFLGDGVTVDKNDILFGKLRPYLAKVYLTQETSVAFGDLLAYRPSKLMESHFLFYYMIFDAFIKIVDSSTYGTKMPRASSEFIGEMPILIPPKEEQIKIVNFILVELNKFDILISKAEKMIQMSKERRTALISSAVTGKIDVRHWQPPTHP